MVYRAKWYTEPNGISSDRMSYTAPEAALRNLWGLPVFLQRRGIVYRPRMIMNLTGNRSARHDLRSARGGSRVNLFASDISLVEACVSPEEMRQA